MASLIREGAGIPMPESSKLSGEDAEARRLAAEVARGNEAAFQQLYDAYHQRIFRLALALGRGDDSLAREVAQAVFVTAARKLRKVESAEHLWNWLARIARQRIAKNRLQQKRDSVVIGVADLPDWADDERLDSQLEERLDAAILEMDREERRLIEMFYFGRLSHKEIAESLNLTPKAVSSRLERAREKLRLLIAKKWSHET